MIFKMIIKCGINFRFSFSIQASLRWLKNIAEFYLAFFLLSAN